MNEGMNESISCPGFVSFVFFLSVSCQFDLISYRMVFSKSKS